jgi:hypothetical protein
MTGDWEEAGKGTFTVGATMLGAKFGPKTYKGADDTQYAMVKTATKDGETTVTQRSGLFGSTWGNIKSLFGGKLAKLDQDGNSMLTADGKLLEGKNIYQISKESMQSRFGKNKAQSAAPAATTEEDVNSVDSQSSTDETVVENNGQDEKKWYSSLSGPHGTGQVLGTVISGAMTTDAPTEH